MEDIVYYCDILAIPFFFLAAYYFMSIKKKTPLEYILLLFSLTGFTLDTIFTIKYIKERNDL